MLNAHWEFGEGTFGETVIKARTDDGKEHTVAHIAVDGMTWREIGANGRLLLHAPDLYNMLLKIITKRKCIVAEVKNLLELIDKDDDEIDAPDDDGSELDAQSQERRS